MKNNKGITLIALVITIIVLLILAGVSIAMLTGENGILTQAESSKEDTSDAEIADRINMALNGEFTNLLVDGYFSGGSKTGTTVNPGTASAIASANGITQGATKEDGDYKIIVATDLKPSAQGAVLTITSNIDSTISGTIKYVPGTGTEEGKYEIDQADYPQ